jgi:hypothetical protein
MQGKLHDRVQRSMEATMQLIGSHSSSPSHTTFVLQNGLYICYVMEMCYIDPILFQLARDENDWDLPSGGNKIVGQEDSEPIREIPLFIVWKHPEKSLQRHQE